MNRTGTPVTIGTLSTAINTRTAELRNTRPPMVGTDPELASRREQLIAERATLVTARSELRQSRRTQSGSAAADRTLIAAGRAILEADELATRMTEDEVRQGVDAAIDDLAVDDEQAPAVSAVIEGTRYTQADASERDQAADFAAALATTAPLVHLHKLGYDCSTARVRTVQSA